MIRALVELALSRAGKAVGGGLAVLAAAGAIYLKGHLDGRASVVQRLTEDRVTILKDGKAIDDEVAAADDDVLCALLGGCL